MYKGKAMPNKHYKNRYDKFIKQIKSLEQRSLDEYTEVHHIQPKCLKGTDNKNNLIILTLREHFLAHWLLWKAYPNYLPLASAFLQMNHKNPKGSKGFQGRITSRTYKSLRSKTYEMLGKVNRNKVNVRDSNGNLLRISKEEYKNSDFTFHTTGKINVFDVDADEWVYIPVEKYYKSKDKYKVMSHFSKFLYIDTETQEILYLTKAEAREKNKQFDQRRFKNIQKKTVACKDAADNTYYLPLELYNSDQHVHLSSNTIIVFDTIDGKNKKINSEDYYNDTLRYYTSTKGKVLAKDQKGNTKLVSKEEFNSGNYVGQTLGFTTVLDRETNTYKQISNQEFLSNRERYTGPCSGKVNVINKLTGTRQQISKDEFDKSVYECLGNKSLLFRCKNKLTNKEKNISIYEWHLVKHQYEIIDIDKYEKIKNLNK